MKNNVENVLDFANANWDDFMFTPATTVNNRGSSGDTVLHKFAIIGDTDSAKILIDNGADVNALGEDGDTPLHRACICSNIENRRRMVSLLLSEGADKKIRNMYGYGPNDVE